MRSKAYVRFVSHLLKLSRDRQGAVKAHKATILLLLLWLGAICFGMDRLLRYSYTPGAENQLALNWPSKSRIKRQTAEPTLVLAAHPYCPCTRSTLGELAIILARCQGRVHTDVLFYRPAEQQPKWSRSDLWQAASEIPGVSVVDDPDGVEMRRFGAATSGEALLYSPDGKLLFHGGITASRGHSGDNYGRDAIIALIHRQPIQISKAPVFGCSLLSKGRAE